MPEKKMKILVAANAFLTLFATISYAEVPGCPQTDAMAAEEGVDHLKTWVDLHVAFKRFHACDDGAIAEGYDDFVARMLATRWDQLDELERLTSADPMFRKFVLSHISGTASNKDLSRALANARDRCVSRSRQLCRDIGRAAGQALRDEQ
jgi:hypothetical protein